MCNINEGEGGYWDYKPDKGMGGTESYYFDDSVFEFHHERTDSDPEEKQAGASDAGR
jgi:hypothetical protein